jgi:hypothetical protein
MVHHRIMDTEQGLQLWRVFAHTLNKQLLTDAEGGPPVWCLGTGLTILISMSRNTTQALELEIFENESRQN